MRQDPLVASWTVNVADTVTNAYGAGAGGTGTTALFTFPCRNDYISRRLLQAGQYLTPESKRGLDYAMFSFEDFYDPANPQTVTDDVFGYITVTRNFHTGVSSTSPILVIPPSTFPVTSAPALTLSGTAPGLTTPYVLGTPVPAEAMNVHMPLHTKTINVANTSSTSTDVLYVAMTPGAPMIEVGAGSNINLTGAAVPEVFLAGNVNVTFSATFLIAQTVGL